MQACTSSCKEVTSHHFHTNHYPGPETCSPCSKTQKKPETEVSLMTKTGGGRDYSKTRNTLDPQVSVTFPFVDPEIPSLSDVLRAPRSGSLTFPSLKYSHLTWVFPVGFFCTEPLDADTPISALSSPGLNFICGFLCLCAPQRTPLLLVKITSQGTEA